MIPWLSENLAYLGTWLGLKIGCAAIRVCPGAMFRFSDGLAKVGFYLLSRFRTHSVANIRIALGDRLSANEIDNVARQSLRNFLRACVEIGVALGSSDDKIKAEIPVVGRRHLDAALAKGKGVLLLSAHFGNFFLVGCRIALDGLPAFVLVNQPREGRFAELLDEYRLELRQKTIHARPRHRALGELTAVLRRNQIAVVIADEYRKGSGIAVPLFGKTVIARRGPVSLALRTGAAVVPACIVRQADDSLRLVIEPELELERGERNAEAIRENTVRITRWLERLLRSYPEQWNWMNIHWWADELSDGAQAQQRHN
jgi:Kdo2-lipid IVA lauroyltransferase/acyltransferase